MQSNTINPQKSKTSSFSVVGILIGAALVSLVAGVSYYRNAGYSAQVMSLSAPIEQRALKFSDTASGGVSVVDFKTGREILTVDGEAGFFRSALRALVRARKQVGIGNELPFALVARIDGRLTLEDPATGQRIDLESFGPTNAASFSQLLVGYKGSL
jgi:putative photosynthetic complex assembly protein